MVETFLHNFLVRFAQVLKINTISAVSPYYNSSASLGFTSTISSYWGTNMFYFGQSASENQSF